MSILIDTIIVIGFGFFIKKSNQDKIKTLKDQIRSQQKEILLLQEQNKQSKIEFEKDRHLQQSSKVKEGLCKAKEKGQIFGRPKKITPEVVTEIKSFLAYGFPHREIKKRTGVSIGMISYIRKEIN